MFFSEGQLRVYLYGQPADLRRSFDGLQALVRHGLGGDPLDGGLYVFINRRGNQIRVLYFDRSGFCLWAKRLEAGRFISDWHGAQSSDGLDGVEVAVGRDRAGSSTQAISTSPRAGKCSTRASR